MTPESQTEPMMGKFKNVLYACVLDALSDNYEIRRMAEDRLKAMEITDDFAIQLIELSLRKDMLISVRQMSSVLLRQYIDTYWITSEIVDGILSSCILRQRIRKQLIEGLAEPISKIRNTFTYCISYIGCIDWPEAWPTLFDELNEYLSGDSEPCIIGTIKVFEELIREADGRKTEEIAPIIIDQLCNVLEEEEKFSTAVRMEAVHVLSLIINVYSNGQDCVKDALVPKLAPLCELFVSTLQATDKTICDYGFKTNIIKFLTLVLHKMSKVFAPYLNMILPTVWGLVMSYGELYTKSVIYNTMYISELEDDEGKVVGFTPLVLAIFDFIHTIVDCTRLNRILTDVLPDILYYDLIFMQITKKMEESWLIDPANFIEDDSNDSFDTTIRITAKDVLTMICHDFEGEVVLPALCHALNRHLTEAESSKASGTCYWWKVHEVCMFTLGLLKDFIISSYKSGTLQFNLLTYIENCHIAFQHPEYPLLLGRSMWFSGQYSYILPIAQFNMLMQNTVQFLRTDEPILRVFAIRTVISHCDGFNDNPNKSLIILSLPTIIDGLIENLSNNQYFIIFFTLSLQTLKIILPLDKALTVSIESRVIPILINLFLKHNADPEIVHEVRQIIKEFCYNNESILAVQEKFVPVLANIFNSSADKVTIGLQVAAMDLLQTIVKCSKPPLGNILVLIGFPAAVKCIIRSDDQMLMESGGECLRCYILLGAEQICSFADSDGKNGLEYILKATSQIIDPMQSEDACKRVGRLVITIINKAGSVLGSSIHFLLRAILSKMQRVELMAAWQSLLIVFVYLFYTQLEAVLSFLTAIPGPTGVSALEFVLIEWLNRQSYFHGIYERIVSVVALSKILEYSVTSEDTRFDNIMVRDEFIFKETDSHKQQGWTKIPILGKAFKIILTELSHSIAENTPQNPEIADDADLSDDDDDDTITTQLSDFLQYQSDPDQHDPLYAQDPIFQINVTEQLTDFVHKFKTIPRFPWFVNYLSDKEKQILHSIGIFV